MKTIHLGALAIDPAAYGSQGNAILGIRDSGKTYTATYLAERLFESGIPFITFDPTGVWRFLRVPGKGKGYPIVVAGGEGADIPLSETSAPKIVEAAMQGGVSLVINLFDEKLSKASWRRIVKDCISVLIHKNHKYGLRHIFLEEAAEFAPQKILDGDVYAVIEKLARMGGNFRLGYTLINQRSQEVNKAVLELCENLFLHRQRGKNSLENLKKWLEVASDHDASMIMKSISTLATGKCWAWMGGSDPRLVTVPAKNSFHPDRRVMHGDATEKTAKAVDVGKFVQNLKTLLPALEAETNANDPKALKAEVARLMAELKKKVPAAVLIDTKPEKKEKWFADGVAAGQRQADRQIAALTKTVRKEVEAMQRKISQILSVMARNAKVAEDALESLKAAAKEIEGATGLNFPELDAELERLAAVVGNGAPAATMQSAHPSAATPRTAPRAPVVPVDGLTRPQQKVLNALAWWHNASHFAPSRAQIAGVAGYSPTSGGFNNLLGGLGTAGLIEIVSPGTASLTDAGKALADFAEAPTTNGLHSRIQEILTAPQWKLLAAAIGAYPDDITRDQLAVETEYSPTSGGFNNLIGSLSTLSMLTKPRAGTVKAAEWLFLS